MATQVSTMSSMPLTLQQQGSSGGIIPQVARVFMQPRAFFRKMPATRHWLAVALLVLVIAGFTATAQTQSATSSSDTAQVAGFDLSLLQENATSTDAAASTAPAALDTTTITSDSNTSLMNALLTASGILVMWAGQAGLLSLVTMLRGYSPRIGKSMQIAVWASLPFALMLILRYIHFAAGGTGGTLGLALLLNQWDGYSTLPEILRRVLAVFLSSLTLFALWNLALLYLGGRYALGGKRWAVTLIMALWIVGATIVPALIGEPQTTITALATSTQTEQTTTQTSTNTASTVQQGSFPMGGQMQSGGSFSGGAPPSGGPPGGG